MTKYISSNDHESFENRFASGEIFQRQTSEIIKNYDVDFVINTDQTGCEYRVNVHRTLSHQGEKF